jgi:hypothetical protein
MNEIKSRNVLLVIIWSYGLFILMHFNQFLGIGIASWKSGQSFEAIISGKFESTQTDFIISMTALIVGIPLVFLVTRFLWGRSMEWMRLRFGMKSLVQGIVLGFLLPVVIMLILKQMGAAKISWQPNGLQSTEVLIIIGYACMAIFSGIAEEIVFRGMAVREIAMKYGWMIAAIVGGVYFGIAHLIIKFGDITFADALWVIFASTIVSLMFIAMYRRSQSLWLPIGFHMTWNFCLKGIMGITLSGNAAKVGLLNVELTGNTFLTGGSFGIEASIISLVVYILVAFLFLRVPCKGHIELLSNQ